MDGSLELGSQKEGQRETVLIDSPVLQNALLAYADLL